MLPATRPAGWVLRSIVSLHLVVVMGQPVFAQYAGTCQAK